MTMQSMDLLPALRELPTYGPERNMSFRELITSLVNTDRAMYAAEFATGVSSAMWYIFDDRSVLDMNVPGTGVNVDDHLRDTMTQAHDIAFPNEDRTVAEHWQDISLNDPDALNNTFMSPLKGKVAEIKAAEKLEQDGFTNVELAPDLGQPGWDISAIGPDGQEVFIQVKAGVSDSQYYDTLNAMENTDYPFHVGTELYDRLSDSQHELLDRLTDIGSSYELVAGINDGLETLSGNMGLDIPDGIVDIVPYVAEIAAGVRLIVSAVKTEKEFKAADRTTKNKIQVTRTLTLMSRMGITAVLAAGGGAGGGILGSVIPGVGNLIGTIGGSFAGAGVGMLLNKHLQPRMLNLALDITGLNHDDLFYYKNKPRIDQVGLTFQQRAKELAAMPA